MNLFAIPPFFKKTTIRLTLSYLSIIMLLSVCYSAVLYNATENELRIRITPQSQQSTLQQTPSASMMTSLSDQGRVRLGKSKNTFLQKLLILNGSTLIIGSFLSYYLARRTLGPVEKAVDSQVRFSADASHELRTPIAALRVSNEVALRDSRLTISKAKNLIQSNIRQVARLEKLTEGLLRLAQADAGISPLRSDVSLLDIVTEAMRSCALPAKAKQITISHVVSDSTVRANSQDIIQVLTILLDNAIKYSEPGSKIDILASASSTHAHISVCDYGCGIPAKDLPMIFNRFYRVDRARSHGMESYGLGLSIAQKIAEENGARLSVESKVGEGSTFTMILSLK